MVSTRGYPFTTSRESRKRRRFWAKVWETTPPGILREGIKAFHDETVRRVLSLTGKPGRWAKRYVMHEEAHPDVQGLSDRVYDFLNSGSQYFSKRGAGHSAILARRYAYCSALFDDKYDDVPDSEARRFFRECSTRAEFDLLEALEAEARRMGMELELGRP